MNNIKKKGITILIISIIIFSLGTLILDTGLSLTGFTTKSIDNSINRFYFINLILILMLAIVGIFELVKHKKKTAFK